MGVCANTCVRLSSCAHICARARIRLCACTRICASPSASAHKRARVRRTRVCMSARIRTRVCRMHVCAHVRVTASCSPVSPAGGQTVIAATPRVQTPLLRLTRD